MQKIKKIFAWIIGLLGISLVILIHEAGHFLACKFFDVRTPIFSIGFGPRIIGYKIGSTMFQIALLPLGGYVSINTIDFNMQSYIAKMIIMLAGIFNNLIFGFLLLNIPAIRRSIAILKTTIAEKKDSGLMGPIGIAGLIRGSVDFGAAYYFLNLAILSINIGIFNLLPIPILDGGQIARISLETLLGPKSDALQLIYIIFTVLFFLLIALLTMKDIRRKQ